ncbi:MAG: sulfate permease [Saprospiraceae bacterium]|nr:sulfate permease [Saprospiraceae bacterium]MCF8252590.1 sulfate permease [Saprospiraceae bacterium]MCF8282647.1 sulfate permease [Bacteroidales bacterium]MCF8314065.1 sulfate permease [Saprospiraceae bacterium]MCF8442951.1 sulfate permease [Saprospiraceae bacterium]
MLKPKLLTVIQEGYTRQQFTADLLAGVIVGVVALPLAIAFGIASGVTPQQGLVTAVVAGFLISAFGGSRVQIGGPTGAFIVIVYGIVQEYGVDGLIAATMMAGVILMLMGFAKLGSVIKYMPWSLIVGFTSGIALVIFSSQIKDFFGLNMGTVPPGFIEKWAAYGQSFSSINWWATVIAAGTAALTFFMPKLSNRVPGSLVAILLATAAVQIFQLPVETIASKFGEIPSAFPSPHLPNIDFQIFKKLLSPALTIALLGAIESLLSAVVADGMTGTNHRSNMELVAQGSANIASALFGGIPATGAIARTVTNVKNGGRTPVAGIVHAITLLLIMLFVGKWAKLIPMSCLAGILLVVAYNMSEWKSFVSMLKGPKNDVLILLVTFFLTVIFDLTVAIEVGMVLAAFLFMRRMAQLSNIESIRIEMDDMDESDDPEAISKFEIPKDVEVYEINGPLFFGASHNFKEVMRQINVNPKVLILRMRKVPMIDATGLYHLREFVKFLQLRKTKVILSGVNPEVQRELADGGLTSLIGEANIQPSFQKAIQRMRELR